MTKPEFISALAEYAQVTKVDAAEMYEDVFGLLSKVVSEGNEVAIPDFGKFEIKTRAEKIGRNPRTGETIPIPAKKAVAFKPGKVLKEAVAQL